MNALKMVLAGYTIPSREGASDSIVDPVVKHSRTALAMARDAGEQTARLTETFPEPHALAKPKSYRVAIKVRGKIFFIHLGDVVSVEAKGKCVWLHERARSFLLRESISVMAEKLETYGFIRIHRSALVNTSCVEEIRPLSTGEYCLRVESGKEYTVTRTYKKNLKSLAEFWIGTGMFLPG